MHKRKRRPTSLAAVFDRSVDDEAQGTHPQIEIVPLSSLRPAARNVRTHSAKQLSLIEKSIEKFKFISPIVVDARRRIVAGHGRYEAAKRLGLAEVPIIAVSHLSATQLRAYALADNRIPDKAGYDRELLAIELGELQFLLPEIGLDLDVTAFEVAEVDGLLRDFATAQFAEEEAPTSVKGTACQSANCSVQDSIVRS